MVQHVRQSEDLSLNPDVGTVPAGSMIWRIYFRGGLHPTNWKDFRYVGPIDARFDHHVGNEPTRQDRAVLYGADDPVTCLAEVFREADRGGIGAEARGEVVHPDPCLTIGQPSRRIVP